MILAEIFQNGMTLQRNKPVKVWGTSSIEQDISVKIDAREIGIGAALVGTLLLVSKIFDGITDIFAGWLVDNTRTKFGKGRTYELCIIGVMICSLALFSARPEWSLAVKCAWIFCMYTLQFSIFTTLRGASLTPYCIQKEFIHET